MISSVTIYSPYSLSYWGGGERWIVEVARRLQDQYGLEIAVLTTDFTGFPGEDKKILDETRQEELRRELNWEEVSARWYPPGILLPSPRSIAPLRRAFAKTDAILFNCIPVQDMVVQLLNAFNHTPIASIYHVSGLLHGQTSLQKIYRNYVFANICNRFDLNIAVNTSAQNRLADLGCSNPVYLPNGVDTQQFHPHRRRSNRGFAVLFVGNLNHDKGADLLPPVITGLRERFNDIEFTIIGDGPLAGEIHTFSEQFDSGVRYVDHVPEDELIEAYANHEVLIQPSRIESFGMVMIESMSCGTPVVAAKTVGSDDIIADAPGSHQVKNVPAEVVEKVSTVYSEWKDSPERYQERRRDVRQYAKTNFEWDMVVDKLYVELKRMMS